MNKMKFKVTDRDQSNELENKLFEFDDLKSFMDWLVQEKDWLCRFEVKYHNVEDVYELHVHSAYD